MTSVAVTSAPARHLTILMALQVPKKTWEANLHLQMVEICCSFPGWSFWNPPWCASSLEEGSRLPSWLGGGAKAYAFSL